MAAAPAAAAPPTTRGRRAAYHGPQSMPRAVGCPASLLRRSLGDQRHPGEPGAVDETQRVHQLGIADRAVAPDINDAGGVFRRQLGKPVLQIGGGDRLVADEGAAFLVDAEHDWL